LKRLVVIDIHWRDDAETSRAPLKLINPEIVGPSGEDAVYKEGCLSFPEQFSEVTRPANVLVRYLNEWGERQEMKVDGLLATCVQHEIDHTDGITFVDHLSPLKRKLIMSKLKKRKRQAEHHVHDAHCHHD
jgi:peptide deformylase